MNTTVYLVMHNKYYNNLISFIANNESISDKLRDNYLKILNSNTEVSGTLKKTYIPNYTYLAVDIPNNEFKVTEDLCIHIKEYLCHVPIHRYLYVQDDGLNGIYVLGTLINNPYRLTLSRCVYIDDTLDSVKDEDDKDIELAKYAIDRGMTVRRTTTPVNTNISNDVQSQFVKEISDINEKLYQLESQQNKLFKLTEKYKDVTYIFCISVLSISIYELISYLVEKNF